MGKQVKQFSISARALRKLQEQLSERGVWGNTFYGCEVLGRAVWLHSFQTNNDGTVIVRDPTTDELFEIPIMELGRQLNDMQVLAWNTK